MDYGMENAVDYHYDKFPPSKLDINEFLNELVKATEALARFDQMLKNIHNNEILLAPLRNQEALLSSRIEGTISTMDEILQYEADGDGNSSNLAKPDVIEIIMYQRTLKNAQLSLEEGYDLSISFIKNMHSQLLLWGRGAEKSPGAFKTEQNYLADKRQKQIRFIPIDPIRLNDGLDNLFSYLEKSSDQILIKTALMHLEFEALHPFKDGNGRIGRMLIPLFLWKNGLLSKPHFYISGYFEDNKDEYIQTMREVSQNGEWEKWIKFFLTAVCNQAYRNLEIAESIKTLYEEMKPKFNDSLSSKWSVIVLDYVFTKPVFRLNRFNKETGIPPASTSGIIKKLTETGMLNIIEEAAGRRAALYSFEPLMRLVRI